MTPTHARTQVSHFVAPDLGVLGFAAVSRYRRELAVALGDPLAPRQHWGALASAFLAHFRGRRVVFLHASTDFARLLQGAFGLEANDIGGETQLLVQVRSPRAWPQCAATACHTVCASLLCVAGAVSHDLPRHGLKRMPQ
jgi:hypothetical protein